jgi:hypothetical protein
LLAFNELPSVTSSYQDTGPPNTLNPLLSSSAEELGLHDDRLLRKLPFPQNFVVALEGEEEIYNTPQQVPTP